MVIFNHFPGCKKEESSLDWPGDKITSEDWCGEGSSLIIFPLLLFLDGWLAVPKCVERWSLFNWSRWLISSYSNPLEVVTFDLGDERPTSSSSALYVAVAAAKWMDVCHLIVASSKAIQSLKTTTNHQSGWRTSQMSDVKWLAGGRTVETAAAGRPTRKGVLFRDNLSCSPVPVPPLLLVSSSVLESKILKNTQPEGLTMDLTMSRLNVVFLSN